MAKLTIVHVNVQQLLIEFTNMLLEKLTLKLPPKREVDYVIELVLSANPLARVPYKMPPHPLAKMRTHMEPTRGRTLTTVKVAIWGAGILPKEGRKP